jgi:hypothetical protein
MGKFDDFFGDREEVQESREVRKEKGDKVGWHVFAERRHAGDGRSFVGLYMAWKSIFRSNDYYYSCKIPFKKQRLEWGD